MLWLPADASHHSARRHPVAPFAGLKEPVAAPAPHAADPGMRDPAVLRAPGALPAAGDDATPASPIEPATVVDERLPGQPNAEEVPTGVKQPALRKAHHKTAHRRRIHRTRLASTSASRGAYRSRYSSDGARGAWLAYR